MFSKQKDAVTAPAQERIVVHADGSCEGVYVDSDGKEYRRSLGRIVLTSGEIKLFEDTRPWWRRLLGL